ncbi:hypothetical protein M9458_051531 [Cirrhinus mrigala]|uniref:L1 transposable element RRM domain-containing protein n=1 Tax=Cirrhinus mrigala TaxID=683832 RepID=A0ABD0MUA3_CIRMR
MADNVKRVHDYAKPTPVEDLSMDCTPLSDTPINSPLAKPSNAAILEAIERLGKKQDMFMEKLLQIERSVASNSTLISELAIKVDSVTDKTERAVVKTDELGVQVAAVIAENKHLWEKVDDLDAYKRRWNLKISGVPEEAGENVKMVAMDIFSRISPGLRDGLQTSIDVAHRIGQRDPDAFPRRIIVQFLSRTHRDRIWLDSKNSEVLRQKGIKITEDLTQRTREARNKLWPLVSQARREGKRAGFKGSFAIIDGKKITADNM